MKRIVVLGSFAMDLVSNTPHIPIKGETVFGGPFRMGPGGKGSNQAIAAARIGAQVDFITKLGRDDFSKIAIDILDKNGVNTKYIMFDDKKPTGVALIAVEDYTGYNSIIVSPGACTSIQVRDIETAKNDIETASMFLTQLETNLEPVYAAIDIAWNANVPIVLNPAPYQQIPDLLLKKVYCLTPNESEAEALTTISTRDNKGIKEAAKALFAKGVQNVIITLGEKGVYLYNKDINEIIPALKVKNVVDTTGAGDSFNGALTYALMEGMDIKGACVFGNAAASLSIQKQGAAYSMPTKIEITKRLEEYGL
jgi:ribokinase